ncbi:response regulator receiver protein [Syntrophomonas wolfei subsp. wolfei str. Goettingen G311]|uniref:Stage 0 sporulation protein A homolog n=2 Tax=Syntrophomonas wolfei TaxID=863 RepID=Q0AUA3_SYNWW|nr:response regulator receiver protein [Syntrophomonas wolfei subsp. wolfei str. Goettingen G311]
MKRRIMIVDDQKGVRRLLEELFKREGWEVYAAADGKEAIEKVGQFQPSILLIDMKMPNMNGLEASQKILEKHQELAIIMMTAYGEMEVVKRALESGVRKCITKPFDILYLRDEVNRIVAEEVS